MHLQHGATYFQRRVVNTVLEAAAAAAMFVKVRALLIKEAPVNCEIAGAPKL